MVRSLNEKLRIRCTRIFVLMLATLILFTSTAWVLHPLVGEFLFLLACVLIGVGTIGRAWCFVYISGRKDGILVYQGPYAICRNPLYFFSLLAAVGLGFATETVLIPLAIAGVFAIYYPFVIRSEERRLESLFGEEFRQYRSRVPAFFPRCSLLKGMEPDNYPVCTRTVRRAMFDLLWFVWIIGLVEMVEALHETQWLPICFRIY